MLKHQIEPLLREFQKADGRGSTARGNYMLIKIIEALVDYIDTPRPAIYSNKHDIEHRTEPEVPEVETCMEYEADSDILRDVAPERRKPGRKPKVTS